MKVKVFIWDDEMHIMSNRAPHCLGCLFWCDNYVMFNLNIYKFLLWRIYHVLIVFGNYCAAKLKVTDITILESYTQDSPSSGLPWKFHD